MSYVHYTPPLPSAPSTPARPTSTTNGTTTTAATTSTPTPTPTATPYPYSAYHPSPYGTPGVPGAYSYGAYGGMHHPHMGMSMGVGQTGVTSYGWSYPYGYMNMGIPQHVGVGGVVAQHQQQLAVSQHHPALPGTAVAAAALVAAQTQHQAQAQGQTPGAAGSSTTTNPGTLQTQYQFHQHQSGVQPYSIAARPPGTPLSSAHITGGALGSSGATSTPMPQRTATFSAYTPSYTRETMGGSYGGTATGGRGGRKQSNLKGLFTKELKNLMYGFGDDRNPANDTVNVMEEILIEYITDVCQTATAPSKKSRLSIDDLRRALSRPADAKKLARMEELLFMQEDIKRARAQFDEEIQGKGM